MVQRGVALNVTQQPAMKTKFHGYCCRLTKKEMMKTLAILCITLPLMNYFDQEVQQPIETETIQYEILCDCGYRDYIHWTDKPLNTI
jgi:hypothetical protein